MGEAEWAARRPMYWAEVDEARLAAAANRVAGFIVVSWDVTVWLD